MRVARYIGNGEVAIEEAVRPACPEGGLVVKTEACGLCSGELMSWYMDGKIPHVLGHEVAGIVVESNAPEFPIGSRIFPHHHAPCMRCEMCMTGRHVHCEQWKRTKLVPGGMADYFAVSPLNLTDTHRVDDLRARDAALIEPLACVCKGLLTSHFDVTKGEAAVIGLGSMGLLHMLALPESTIGYDLDEKRVLWARQWGLNADTPNNASAACYVFVCPGSQAAFEQAMQIVEPGGTIILFAPLPPGESLKIPQSAYFSDVTIVNSYSCGPSETQEAIRLIRKGRVKAEQICSNFIEIERLPEHYRLMKSGEILKPMVIWD